MKRKQLKGIATAIMALLIFIVPLLSVAATDADKPVPRIWVHGFMSSQVYEDISDPN